MPSVTLTISRGLREPDNVFPLPHNVRAVAVGRRANRKSVGKTLSVRRPDWYAPFTFDDGHIYDVLDLDVCKGGSGVARHCHLEVMQRGADYSHLFFHFRFYSSIFRLGTFDLFREDGWAQVLPCSRWTKPIVVECR